MTQIKAVFAGKKSDLEMALFCSIKFASFKNLFDKQLYVTWIFETEDYEEALERAMDNINIDRLGPVEILRIG
jgi:hypothetical protein